MRFFCNFFFYILSLNMEYKAKCERRIKKSSLESLTHSLDIFFFFQFNL